MLGFSNNYLALALVLFCGSGSAPANHLADGLPAGPLVLKENYQPMVRGNINAMKFYAGGLFSALIDLGFADRSWCLFDHLGNTWPDINWQSFRSGGAPFRPRIDGDWFFWDSREIREKNQAHEYDVYHGEISDLAVLPSGGMVIAGEFNDSAGNAAGLDHIAFRLMRLQPGLDLNNDPVSPDWVSEPVFPGKRNDWNLKVYPLNDGSHLVYDLMDSIGSLVSARRVLINGTVQPFINSSIDGKIWQVWQQADGKILLSGYFYTEVSPGIWEPSFLIRVLNDGSYDPSFQSVRTGYVQNFAIQTDGKILLAQDLDYDAGIRRLLPDGTTDPDFQIHPVTNLRVALTPDGQLVAFDTRASYHNADPEQFPAIMRLHNALPEERLTVVGNTIRWMRGGTVPEINWAKFELANEDGSWTELGMTQRVPGGWELTSTMALPNTGKIRAFSNQHTPLVDSEFTMEAFFGPPPLSAWKAEHLGDANAPDLGNPDGDAAVDLVEYATGSNPNEANEPLILVNNPGEPMSLVFHRVAKHFDVDLILEATSDVSEPWETLARSLNGGPLRGKGFTHEVELDSDTTEYHCYVSDTEETVTAAKRFYRIRVEHDSFSQNRTRQ